MSFLNKKLFWKLLLSLFLTCVLFISFEFYQDSRLWKASISYAFLTGKDQKGLPKICLIYEQPTRKKRSWLECKNSFGKKLWGVKTIPFGSTSSFPQSIGKIQRRKKTILLLSSHLENYKTKKVFLISHSLSDGKPVWERTLYTGASQALHEAQILSHPRHLLVILSQTKKQTLLCVDEKTGKNSWKLEFQGHSSLRHPFLHKDSLFFQKDALLSHVDLRTGKHLLLGRKEGVYFINQQIFASSYDFSKREASFWKWDSNSKTFKKSFSLLSNDIPHQRNTMVRDDSLFLLPTVSSLSKTSLLERISFSTQQKVFSISLPLGTFFPIEYEQSKKGLPSASIFSQNSTPWLLMTQKQTNLQALEREHQWILFQPQDGKIIWKSKKKRSFSLLPERYRMRVGKRLFFLFFKKEQSLYRWFFVIFDPQKPLGEKMDVFSFYVDKKEKNGLFPSFFVPQQVLGDYFLGFHYQKFWLYNMKSKKMLFHSDSSIVWRNEITQLESFLGKMP